MKLNIVDFSTVEKIGYSAKNKHLFIVFKYNPDIVYKYTDVPNSVFKALSNSDSKGRFVNTKIRDNYEFTKVSLK